MYINRGNHETKDMNRTYGFEGEAKHKHGEQTYKVCRRISIRLFVYFIYLLHTALRTRIHSPYVILTPINLSL
jgi:hypothetical protein